MARKKKTTSLHASSLPSASPPPPHITATATSPPPQPTDEEKRSRKLQLVVDISPPTPPSGSIKAPLETQTLVTGASLPQVSLGPHITSPLPVDLGTAQVPTPSLPLDAKDSFKSEAASVSRLKGAAQSSSVDGSANAKPSWTDVVQGSGLKMSKKGTPFTLETGELCVKIPNSVITKHKKCWENFVIGQFQGKPPTPGTLFAIVNGIWSKKMRNISVSRLTEKAFLIRIPNAATRFRVLAQGMWHIDNQTMFVAKWEPGLTPVMSELTSVPVWLEFRKVPPQFFNIDGLEHIAGLLGDPKFLHPTTANMTNLEVAKVFTSIDPTKHLPETISVQFDSRQYHRIEVSSSWLPPICEHCDAIGHSLKSCPTAPITCAHCNSSGHLDENCSRSKGQGTKRQKRGVEPRPIASIPVKPALEKTVQSPQPNDLPKMTSTKPVAKPADGVWVKKVAAPGIRIITPPGPVPKTKEKESKSTRKGKEIEAPSEAPSGYNSSIAAGNVSGYSSGDTSGSDWSSGEDNNPDDDNEHFVPYVSKKLMRQLEALRKKQSPRGNSSKYNY